jgi:hypothetical protein
MTRKCAICDRNLIYPRDYFCGYCFRKYKSEILSKERWTQFLAKEERKRRRQEARSPIFVYLGDKWDVDDCGNLVLKSYG